MKVAYLLLAIPFILQAQHINKNVKRQMELEKKYKKEQKFYQAKDYDFKSKQVDKRTLKKVPKIEPDYDFDITDVYRDDI